jgi:hypothetical protein
MLQLGLPERVGNEITAAPFRELEYQAASRSPSVVTSETGLYPAGIGALEGAWPMRRHQPHRDRHDQPVDPHDSGKRQPRPAHVTPTPRSARTPEQRGRDRHKPDAERPKQEARPIGCTVERRPSISHRQSGSDKRQRTQPCRDRSPRSGAQPAIRRPDQQQQTQRHQPRDEVVARSRPSRRRDQHVECGMEAWGAPRTSRTPPTT